MTEQLVDIESKLNPYPIYAKMRRYDPVFYDPQRGSWNVFCFEDVQRVLSEYETFSSQFSGTTPDPDMPFAASLISTDPPRHRQLRSLVTQAFTPRAVDALAPRIQEIVAERLTPVRGAGKIDIIRDLAYPLPVIVIAEMLGIPSADRENFKRWSDYTVQAADFGTEVDFEKFMSPEMMEMGMYFMNMIEQRRASPGDDLISGLLDANIDGQHLSQIELLGFCVLLLVAGNETTTNLIGNAILTFAEQPELWAELRTSPDLLPSAIEEVLRYRSPVQAMFRVTKTEVELRGKAIPAYSPMVAWMGSANHDDTIFPNADRFDIRRSPNKHLAFGNGIHYCLGAPLARLEARIALSAMLERFEDFSLSPNTQLQRHPSLIVYGVKSLPLDIHERG